MHDTPIYVFDGVGTDNLSALSALSALDRKVRITDEAARRIEAVLRNGLDRTTP